MVFIFFISSKKAEGMGVLRMRINVAHRERIRRERKRNGEGRRKAT